MATATVAATTTTATTTTTTVMTDGYIYIYIYTYIFRNVCVNHGSHLITETVDIYYYFYDVSFVIDVLIDALIRNASRASFLLMTALHLCVNETI